MSELKVPYKYEGRDYQERILNSRARYKIVVLHRRSGKTKTALNMQIEKAVYKKGLYLYLLPTYKQAKKVIWMDDEMMKHFPEELIEKKNDSELYIKLKNGSTWMLGGCDDPDSWRGTAPVDVVMDEYAEMKEEIWTAIVQPVLAENKGTATFIFTPKGQNHAWKLIQQTKDNPDWDYWKLNVDDTGAIEHNELVEAKKNMTEALYQQEFMCEFLEGAGSVFRRVEDNVWTGELYPQTGRTYQLGVDLAKYQDWTVITPYCLNDMTAGKQIRFNQVDWNLQKARIQAESTRYNRAKIMIDSTGIGDPITEDLQKIGLNVKPFKFTENSRDQLLDNLAIRLEQDLIKIPNEETLKDELKSFQNILTKTNKIKKQVPDGLHDDTVMSLALACWDTPRLPTKLPDHTLAEDKGTMYVNHYGV